MIHTCECAIEQHGNLVVCNRPADNFIINLSGRPRVFCHQCCADYESRVKTVCIEKITEAQYLVMKVMDS